jgi:type I restriction enzyme, R subunit
LLLTGFDAPILQTMYLDKPMRDHGLLQAICRTNRLYPGKTHGLIVDYLGIFDDVSSALDFDEGSVKKVITNLEALKQELPGWMQKCLAFFPGVDRSVGGYEGLIAAQQCLPDNEKRDAFAADFSALSRHWEALSPDAVLEPYRADYVWLTQVYESVKPASGNGKLLWHALGAKTLDLVHCNVHVEEVRDDLDTLVMDADALEMILGTDDPGGKGKEVEIKIVARLKKHAGNPEFVALGERLERLREKHEQGLVNSIEFLKALLSLAKDVVEAERKVDPEGEQAMAKAALTELFSEVKDGDTPVIVDRIVGDIDDVVRVVRFDGWQATNAGERAVKQELRKIVYVRYKIKDQDLFDRAFGYVRQYY